MTDTTVSTQTVYDIIDEIGPCTAQDIVRVIAQNRDIDLHCDECGQPRLDNHHLKEHVDESMTELIGQNRIASTPDWEYYVPT